MGAANDDEASRILDILLATEIRADLLTLFHKNPGVVDTIEGVALRIGSSKNAIQEDLEELIKLGILVRKQIRANEAILLDAKRDREIQDVIDNHIRRLRPSKS